MRNPIPQFGTKVEGEYKDRPCAYVVVFNEENKLLVLKVDDKYHLPGGGIDLGESPVVTVIRESQEEAGCEIDKLRCIGRANQFFIRSDKSLVNKVAIFYRANMVSIDPLKKIEEDHEVCWLSIDEFIQSSSTEFHKWAVKRI